MSEPRALRAGAETTRPPSPIEVLRQAAFTLTAAEARQEQASTALSNAESALREAREALRVAQEVFKVAVERFKASVS